MMILTVLFLQGPNGSAWVRASCRHHAGGAGRIQTCLDHRTQVVNETGYKRLWGQHGVGTRDQHLTRNCSCQAMAQESRQIRDGRNAARYQLVNEGGCCDAADGVEAEKLQGSLDRAYRLDLPVIRRVGNLEHSGGQDGMRFNLGGQLRQR